MKPLYNSTAGKLRRPRKTGRALGQMSRELKRELTNISLNEATMFKIGASLAIINLGVDIALLGR